MNVRVQIKYFVPPDFKNPSIVEVSLAARPIVGDSITLPNRHMVRVTAVNHIVVGQSAAGTLVVNGQLWSLADASREASELDEPRPAGESSSGRGQTWQEMPTHLRELIRRELPKTDALHTDLDDNLSWCTTPQPVEVLAFEQGNDDDRAWVTQSRDDDDDEEDDPGVPAVQSFTVTHLVVIDPVELANPVQAYPVSYLVIDENRGVVLHCSTMFDEELGHLGWDIPHPHD